MSRNNDYPYCDFFKYHDSDFNFGLCPCGDSFKISGELRCLRTHEAIKKYRLGGYYFKCEYMRIEKYPGQITFF